jgi:tetratricopeptide (TPR) repeat protein
MRAAACGLVLLAALGSSGVTAAAAKPPAAASAADAKTRARASYRVAEKKFAARDYDGALEAYREAWAAVPEPVFLFDIAQCHRLAGRASLALFYYGKYLEAAPAAPNRADVEALVAELRTTARPATGTLTADGHLDPGPTVAAEPPAPSDPPAPVAALAPPGEVALARTAAGGGRGRGPGLGVWLAVGGAAVAVAAGVLAGVLLATRGGRPPDSELGVFDAPFDTQ